MLQFRRYSKQWYWKPMSANTKDDIMAGDYNTDKSCNWEFRIVEELLLKKQYAVQVQIFNDAVKSLKNKRVVKMLVELENANRLDEAELVLKRNGFREVVEEKNPTRRS